MGAAEFRDRRRPAPKRGQWIALTLAEHTVLVRFVGAAPRRFDDGRVWWEVDRGAYGTTRDDLFIRADAIVAWTPAQEPPLRLSYVDPRGTRRFVGRYATTAEAEAAMAPMRSCATDIRIEARP